MKLDVWNLSWWSRSLRGSHLSSSRLPRSFTTSVIRWDSMLWSRFLRSIISHRLMTPAMRVAPLIWASRSAVMAYWGLVFIARYSCGRQSSASPVLPHRWGPHGGDVQWNSQAMRTTHVSGAVNRVKSCAGTSALQEKKVVSHQ
jgi:hypothetical protein